MGVSPWDDVSRTFMIQIRLEIWPQCQIYRVFDMFSCPAHNLFFWFDKGLPYLAHGCITMRRYDTYIHDPDTTLTFDLKVKFKGFMTWFCGQALAFLSFDIVILCLARECITMVRCVSYIHELCTLTLTVDLNIKVIFSPPTWVLQDAFALRHRHTKFWHIDVSPLYNILCIFLTLVWPWPLTYMWVAGVSLISFTHSFYFVFFKYWIVFYFTIYGHYFNPNLEILQDWQYFVHDEMKFETE